MEPVEYEVMAAVEDRHWWYSGMRALAAAWLDPLFADRRDLAILDAGCGTGGNGEFLRRYGHPIGLDLARQALILGRRRLPGRILGASVVELPFPDACFDLVTSFDVLYHRAVIDQAAALREAWRVLKPGGYLLIRLPAYQWLSSKHDRAVHGQRRYTVPKVRAALAGAELHVERLSYINSLLFPIPLAQRGIERLMPRAHDTESDLLPPPRTINQLLRLIVQAEAAWLRKGGSFGWGLSVLGLARKIPGPALGSHSSIRCGR